MTLKSFKILATCAFFLPDQQALCKNCPLIKMEMDATPDPALPQPPADLTAQQKLAVAIPERTEEDEQRLFRLFKGWTFSERDGQVRQCSLATISKTPSRRNGDECVAFASNDQTEESKAEELKGLQNAEVHLCEDHNGIVDPRGKKQRPAKAAEKPPQSIATILQLNPKEPKEQYLINMLIKRFDKTVFQQKLVNWIVNSNQLPCRQWQPSARGYSQLLAVWSQGAVIG
jgi:hypothetical protein